MYELRSSERIIPATVAFVRQDSVLLAGSLVTAAYLAGAAVVDTHGLPVVCPFRIATGLLCPLCGLTTATHQLFQGNLESATAAHPLVVPFVVVLGYLAVVGPLSRLSGRFPVKMNLALLALLGLMTAAAAVRLVSGFRNF